MVKDPQFFEQKVTLLPRTIFKVVFLTTYRSQHYFDIQNNSNALLKGDSGTVEMSEHQKHKL